MKGKGIEMLNKNKTKRKQKENIKKKKKPLLAESETLE